MSSLEMPSAPIRKVVRAVCVSPLPWSDNSLIWSEKVLPDNIQVGKDCLALFQKASGIFILYITSAAADIANQRGRSTISFDDITAALQDCDFPELVEPVTDFLKTAQSKRKNLDIGGVAAPPRKRQKRDSATSDPNAALDESAVASDAAPDTQ